jgi:hypothetical protein
MTWDEIGPSAIVPGMPGDDEAWERVAQQHDRLIDIWRPPLVQSLAGAGGGKAAGASGTIGKWRAPGSGRMLVRVWLERDTGSTTATLTVTTDPASTSTTMTASQAAGRWYALLHTLPAGVDTEVTLALAVSAGTGDWAVGGIEAFWAAGVGAFGDVMEAEAIDTDEPVPSERVERLIRTPGRGGRCRTRLRSRCCSATARARTTGRWRSGLRRTGRASTSSSAIQADRRSTP